MSKHYHGYKPLFELNQLATRINQQLNEAGVKLGMATALDAARVKTETANEISRLYIRHSTNIWATMPVLLEAVHIGYNYGRLLDRAAEYNDEEGRDCVTININGPGVSEASEADMQRIADKLTPFLEA